MNIPKRQGYTLVEVMVAVVILTIALPGLAMMMISGRKAQIASLRMDQAAGVGQLMLDSLQLQPGAFATDGTRDVVVAGTSYQATIRILDLGGSRVAHIAIGWSQGGDAHRTSIQGVLR